jgi:NTP pyrophosphatase (non-canonical NTP hydrolase)
MQNLTKSSTDLQDVVYNILLWADARNLIEGSTDEKQCLKLQSEIGELSDSILKRDLDGVIDGIGDCLVVLTIIAAQNGMSLAECAKHAYAQIQHRKGVMYNGTFIKESDKRYKDALAKLGKTQ